MRNLPLACLAILLTCFAAQVHALDYHIEWVFEQPLADQSEIEFAPRFEQLLIYSANSGELIYHSPGASVHGSLWNPPDLLSRSGRFIDDATLTPFPFYQTVTDSGILENLTPFPRLVLDQQIDNHTINGSEAIQIHHDRFEYWPGSIDDPGNLARYGLDQMPTSYSYGKVLPVNLTEAFLLEDLYASSPLELVYQIPEPSCASIVLIGAVLGFVRFRNRLLI